MNMRIVNLLCAAVFLIDAAYVAWAKVQLSYWVVVVLLFVLAVQCLIDAARGRG